MTLASISPYSIRIVPDFIDEPNIDDVRAKKLDVAVSLWDLNTDKRDKQFGDLDKIYEREYQVDIFCNNPLTREFIKEELNKYYDSKIFIEDISKLYFDDGGHMRYDTRNDIYRNTFALGVSYPVEILEPIPL